METGHLRRAQTCTVRLLSRDAQSLLCIVIWRACILAHRDSAQPCQQTTSTASDMLTSIVKTKWMTLIAARSWSLKPRLTNRGLKINRKTPQLMAQASRRDEKEISFTMGWSVYCTSPPRTSANIISDHRRAFTLHNSIGPSIDEVLALEKRPKVKNLPNDGGRKGRMVSQAKFCTRLYAITARRTKSTTCNVQESKDKTDD
jgi:hypothetical protein